MLARAELAGSTTDVPSSIGIEGTSQGGAPTFATDKADDPAAVEDTHAHAFDPFAGQPAISTSVTASTNGHALDDEEDGAPRKPSSVAAKPIEKSPAPISAKAPAAKAVAVPTPIAVPAEIPIPAALAIPVKVEPAPVKAEPAPAKPEIAATAAPELEAAPASVAPVEPVAISTPVAAPAAAPVSRWPRRRPLPLLSRQ